MKNLSQERRPPGQYFNLDLTNMRQEGYHSTKRSIYNVSVNINTANICRDLQHPEIWAVFLFTAPYPEQNATKIF